MANAPIKTITIGGVTYDIFDPRITFGSGTSKYLREDGSWVVPPDNNTTYSVATTTANGLMAAADKVAVNKIGTGTLSTSAQTLIGAINELKNGLSPSYTIVSWASGSVANIASMLQAHYDGRIDIHRYWNVGDTRTVSLSAMSATGVGESHVAQSVELVLLSAGGKELATPINGVSQCAFVVGLKDCLKEKGYMNSSNTNTGGWQGSGRRTWCNNVFKKALPSDLLALFKSHFNYTANGTGDTAVKSTDLFALPSEVEVFGTVSRASATAEANNTQFDYYATSANRIKKVSGSADCWWERSPGTSNSYNFCCVNSSGGSSIIGANNAYGLAPFGCI